MGDFEKINTYIVIKVTDAGEYLSTSQKLALIDMIETINVCRCQQGKKINHYYVVNRDEPYAEEVFGVIYNGEIKKRGNGEKQTNE